LGVIVVYDPSNRRRILKGYGSITFTLTGCFFDISATRLLQGTSGTVFKKKDVEF
jgi:hypothetical protein